MVKSVRKVIFPFQITLEKDRIKDSFFYHHTPIMYPCLRAVLLDEVSEF